jgi:hypothetical protein
MREFVETSLEVSLPSGARMDAGLWFPVFFVVIEALGPVGRGRGSRKERCGRGWRRWNVCTLKGQVGVGRKGGNGQRREETLNLLCLRWDH